MRKTLFLITFCSSYLLILAQENCNNRTDDDFDGLIDYNDPDCACAGSPMNSLVQNPSFETYDTCPNNASQMHFVNDWIAGNDSGTTDYLNTCGMASLFAYENPPAPLPSGNGYVGIVFASNDPFPPQIQNSEYVGQCLNTAMQAGTTYTIQFSMAPAQNIPFFGILNAGLNPEVAIYGHANCTDLPWGGGSNTGWSCPLDHVGSNWVPLATSVVSFKSLGWETVAMTFTPATNISAVAIGPSCAYTQNTSGGLFGGIDYYYLDGVVFSNPDCTPLSTEILSFTAECKTGRTLIQWEANRESETTQFVVEQSTDNITWTEITMVEGTGNSNSVYELYADNNTESISYYRLKYSSGNALPKYSNTVEVESCQSTVRVGVYPNPANTRISIAVSGSSKNTSMLLMDNLGQTVMDIGQTDLSGTKTTVELDISAFPVGIYLLKVITGNEIITEKIIKQ